MAKKSQRRPVRNEKDQSGCIWGFISMFDFRHGRSTRKLIADKRQGSRHVVGAVHSKNKSEKLNGLDEDCKGNPDIKESHRRTVTNDAYKPSVKKLIQEEMFIDQHRMKDKGNADVESRESRVGHEDPENLDFKRKRKSRKKSRDMDNHDLNADATFRPQQPQNQHLRKLSKDNLNLDMIMEEFCHLESSNCMMHDQKLVIAENSARDAIHKFVNQMIYNGKDMAEAKKAMCSQEFVEALHIISSDQELFLRFLQDPNSFLLKYVQEFGNAQETNDKEYSSGTGSNMSRAEQGHLRESREIVNHKQRNFFRKKVKSQAKNPTNGNETAESSNRIVILKPGIGQQNSKSENSLPSSLEPSDISHYKGPSARAGSHFSLTELKKKLKHAMGKERHENPEVISKKLPSERQKKGQGSKIIGRDNVGMKSPTKDHFFIEKIARPSFDGRRGDKASAMKGTEVMLGHENGGNPKQRVSNLYVEAKKHLCEMLSDGDENIDISSRQIPKSLGRILSLPEYNFSPLASPGRGWGHNFVTAQTRFSAIDKIREANDDALSPKQPTTVGHLDQAADSPKKQSRMSDESSDNKVRETNSEMNFSDDLIQDDKMEIGCYPVKDEIISEVNVESAEETNVLDFSSEPGGLIAANDQNCDISNVSDDTKQPQCLNQEVSEENQPPSPTPISSPSHSTAMKIIEELECVTDISGRPSPVSVLETTFLEDNLSPENARFESVKEQIQPQQIQFEEESSHVDQMDRVKHCVEENELVFDYVKAVLQASGLNIDQLWIKCLSSDQILDPSLFDQVAFFSNQLCHDKKLLFDCINEVLVEICWQYLGILLWVSFVKPSMKPTPNMDKVTLKVWDGVCWYFQPLPPPHTLDQIVRKDMARSDAWMDLQFDAETIGFEMGEAILAELMEDAILSFVSENTESESSQLQLELKEMESSINA